MLNQVSYAQIESQKGQRSLKRFIEYAWAEVEPARPFKDNWHIDALCEHLEAVTRGDIRRLVINIPPGSMKSLTCSVFWPAWSWTHSPGTKWITASYAQMVARRDGVRARRLMDSAWYQERWGKSFTSNDDDWSSMRYSNNQGGIRLSTTVAGAVTGEHSDIQLVDDPIKPIDAPGERQDSAALDACAEWWDETMSSRMADPLNSARVIVMQRLHTNDLTGHVLKNDGYEHLCLPMTMEPKCSILVPHKCSMPKDAKGRSTPPTTPGFKDPRTDGELLWPGRFPQQVVDERKKEMGAQGHACQDQQRPTPASGSIIKKEWIKYYTALPSKVDKLIGSWDMTFKETKKGSFVVGQVWAKCGPDFYLVDQFRDRTDFNGTLAAVKQQSLNHPKLEEKLIEDKANGPAIMSALKKHLTGVMPVQVSGSKEARMAAVSYLFASGNVFIPSPLEHAWVEDYVYEIVTFPRAPNDDQADTTTQALDYLTNLYQPPEDIDMGDDAGGDSEFLEW